MAVVLMTASGLLVQKLPAAAKHRPWVRPRGVPWRRFFWTSGLRRRREIARLLPDLIRAVVGAPRRRLRRRRDDSTHQPARAGLRAAGLARERRSGRLAAMAGLRPHGDARILQDDGNPRCRGPSHRRPRLTRRRRECSWSARRWPGAAVAGSARHGQRLVVDYSTAGTYPYEVVGVVGDLRFRGPRSVPRPRSICRTRRRPT